MKLTPLLIKTKVVAGKATVTGRKGPVIIAETGIKDKIWRGDGFQGIERVNVAEAGGMLKEQVQAAPPGADFREVIALTGETKVDVIVDFEVLQGGGQGPILHSARGCALGLHQDHDLDPRVILPVTEEILVEVPQGIVGAM